MANFSGSGGSGRPAPDPNSRFAAHLVRAKHEIHRHGNELPNNKAEPTKSRLTSRKCWSRKRVGGKLGRLDPRVLPIPNSRRLRGNHKPIV